MRLGGEEIDNNEYRPVFEYQALKGEEKGQGLKRDGRRGGRQC